MKSSAMQRSFRWKVQGIDPAVIPDESLETVADN
jgi:hypothetical protein